MVFVSYAGLTKIASVSEEVVRPERNLPLGMILSLATATLVYVAGVFSMVALLEPDAFRGDLTPVASIAGAAPGVLPTGLAVTGVAVVALAAFASATNAAILSAARYPFAMARDRLIGGQFAKLSRFETPAPAILVTAAAMIAAITLLDVKQIASLASAFLLLVFALINVAVIIMRESHIRAYDPGFSSPGYPWTQIAGAVVSVALIVQMGAMAMLFTAGLGAACVGWYMGYARHRVQRSGALFHLFDRLGARRHQGLESELLAIVQEKGLRDEDPFEQEIAWAPVVDLAPDEGYAEALWGACELLAERVGADTDELVELFSESTHSTATPMSPRAGMPHLLLPEVEWPALAIVRAAHGLDVPAESHDGDEPAPEPVAAFFVIGSEHDPGQQLRFLAELDARVNREGFVERWLAADNEADLKEALLHDDRQLALVLDEHGPTRELVDTTAAELDLPPGTLITLVARDGRAIVPDGDTRLRAGDRITIVGDPDSITEMRNRYQPEPG
jgi:mannitol/fructose-specific phosphotransferase system IIA component (Ntr-type)